jgi:hypothetical protein
MAYLTYIVDNYELSLPSTVSFIHSHRDGFIRAWHTDTPMHDNVDAMRALVLPYVQQNGYVNLRCHWNPGCGGEVPGTHVTPGIWEELFNNTSTPPVEDDGEWKISWPLSTSPSSAARGEETVYLLGQTSAACCAQFAVSREQILRRPLDDYIKFRDWIIQTGLNDARSGRVMEYIWHVIFGKESV